MLETNRPMTLAQQATYAQIAQFEIDCPRDIYPFSTKLSRDYGWSGTYAYRAIQEYKKFVFLTISTDQQLSPSTAIDRVWHQHLLYTHSYWDNFCGKVLGVPLHHTPSSGGSAEGFKYHKQYCQTLEYYRQYFGNPPEDIWHTPKNRTEGHHYQWIDKASCWVVHKPKMRWNTLAKRLIS